MSTVITDNEENTDNLSKASTAVFDDTKSSTTSKGSGHDVTSCNNLHLIIQKKPFFGGYKHKLTGVTYFHASTQTDPPPWNDSHSERFNRDCQTVETKDEIQQTCQDVATQVQVRNIFMQNSEDKSVASTDSYIYADDIRIEMMSKVIVMQKFVRQWLAQKELKKRRESAQERLLWEEKQKRIRDKQDLDWFKDLQKRKLDPIEEDDFQLLFSDLQNWWEHETENISETEKGNHQQKALWALVNEEVKKIADINRTKSVVENKKVYDKRQKMLKEASRPKLWKAHKKKIKVITESTQKFESLQTLYKKLSMKYISPQDRMDALQTLIQLLQNYNNNLTNTLLQLAQREVDLLMRGTKLRNLEGLRTRIQNLFWQYVKQPLLSSQMHDLAAGKQLDASQTNILCCSSCKQFYTLPPDSINEAVGKSVLGNCFVKCKKCLYLENEGWIRKDVELYKKILNLLIEEEKQKSAVSSLVYILQPCDIKHLVEAIWKRQSCLSGAAEVKDLEFVRYDVNKSWTPWNCLLVTRDEAAIVSGIPNPQKTYDEDFKKFVYQRHVAARNYFATIPRFLPYVTKSFTTYDTDYEHIEI